MKQWLRELSRGKNGSRDLPFEGALEAAQDLFDGRASDAQAGAFLVALRLKGETAEELAAFARALQQRSITTPLEPGLAAKALAVSGGTEGRESFNASLGASVLCALAGLPTVMKGSEPLPPRQGLGLAQTLRALGLSDAGMEDGGTAARDLGRFGLAYLDLEAACPPLGRLRQLRQDLDCRTVLHTAERLLMPLGCQQQLLGAQHPQVLERLRQIAPRGQDAVRTVAVLGVEGSEDLPTHKPAQALVFEEAGMRPVTLDATDVGLQTSQRRALSPEEQQRRTTAVLSGESGSLVEAERKQILFNTACRLWLFGQVLSLGEGLELAQDLLRSGRGLTLLLKWVHSRQAKVAAP